MLEFCTLPLRIGLIAIEATTACCKLQWYIHYTCGGNGVVIFLLIQAVKPPSPMERLAIFLLSFYWRFIQVIKPAGPMEQFTIFPLGLHLGLTQFKKIPGPVEQLNIWGSHLGLHNCKLLKKGKRPTCMKSVEGSLFRQFFQKNDMEHSYPKMYQSHKTLRMCSKMSLLKT